MKKKTTVQKMIRQIVKEELQNQGLGNEQSKPCVVLGKPTIDPDYQKQIKRRKKRTNQPYFPSFDSLDVPPLLCHLEFDDEQND